MKPILFPSDATTFTTNGIGALHDAISCEVVEERNGAYELTMRYPVDGLHYKEIKHSRLIYCKPADGRDPQPFRIYRISKPIDGRVEVNAEHVSYQTSHIPVSPFTASSAAAALVGLGQHAAVTCPFTFWTDIVATADFKVDKPVSMRSKMLGKTGSIVDVYGGEWEFDMYDAKLHHNRGTNRNVVIRYGKNLTDLDQEESIASTYTGIYPYWYNSTDNILVELPEKILYSPLDPNYPYHRILPVDFTSKFTSAPSESDLRSAGNAYITDNNLGVPKVSIKVSFVPLWQTEEYKDIAPLERVWLCDTVTVEFPKLGVSATAKVTKTRFDVLADRYIEVCLGDATSTLASTINNAIEEVKQEVPSMSYLEQSIQRATDIITGADGGYVQLVYEATTGHPKEIVVLDNEDLQQALKLWRWNLGGFGYSRTGYSGPFGIAITMDGEIVADYITTGTLTANIIKAGILSDDAGKNYWDMVTGEFKLSSSVQVQVSGSTYDDIDDFIVRIYDADLTQTKTFNKLTNNGAMQGIYMASGQLYINAEYIQTGTMDVDHVKMHEIMSVYNGSGSGASVIGEVGAGSWSYSYGPSPLLPITEIGACIRSQNHATSVKACQSALVLEAPYDATRDEFGIVVNGALNLSNGYFDGFITNSPDLGPGTAEFNTGMINNLIFWHGLLVGYVI